MYSWIETSSEQTESELGGGETTTTTYDYNEEWTEMVPDSNSFYDTYYYNPEKYYDSDSFRVSSASVGVYDLNFDGLELPDFNDLNLDESILDLSVEGELASGYVYIAYYAGGSIASPDVGDVRISYSVLANNSDGTVFGKTNGSSLETYYDADTDTELYRLFDGGRDQAS